MKENNIPIYKGQKEHNETKITESKQDLRLHYPNLPP